MGRELELNNTKDFMRGYSQKVADLIRIEIGRNRRRDYSGRVTNAPINTTGEGRTSVESEEDGLEFPVVGNDYLEDVSEGTDSTNASKSDILKWINDKRIRFRNKKGQFLTMSDSRKDNLAEMIVEKLDLVGIRATNFLQDAIDKSYDRLNGVEDAVVDDVIDNIEHILIDRGYVKTGDKLTLNIKK